MSDLVRPPIQHHWRLASECGQILETLKGQPPSYCKLQIRPNRRQPFSVRIKVHLFAATLNVLKPTETP